jgi:chemotaxis protein MotB
MARRRRHQEEHENHERWLVSYADFITLLFAFFVVMYAISSVNEGKYRVLSDSLNAVFADPSHIDRRLPALASNAITENSEPAVIPSPLPVQPPREGGRAEDENSIDALEERLGITLENYVSEGLVEIARVGDGLQVLIKSKLLFDSGSAQLARGALAALRDLAAVLKPLPNPVQVEGHTDNVPISTLQFPSNWELSAARAASVVHFFSRLGIHPDRLSAIGYGEFRPVASNATEEGRARNRRVTVMLQPAPAVPWAEGPALPEPAAPAPDAGSGTVSVETLRERTAEAGSFPPGRQGKSAP